MAKISAMEIRGGVLIEWEGRLLRVSKARHVHVGGRGGAYVQVEARHIDGGGKASMRLHTDDRVERPQVEQRRMRYLYADASGHVFMDEETFEQSALAADLLEDRADYLLPDTPITANVHEGRVIGVDLPSSVVLTVTATEPQAKGVTASASYKPATVETGKTVMVPPFIEIGAKIKINTENGDYLERVE